MTDTNDPIAVAEGAGEIDRLRRLFADAFGADVLDALPLRLDLLRQRRVLRERDWNRFNPRRSN